MNAAELRHALAIVAHVLNDGEHSHRPGAANHWLSLDSREHLRRGLVHADRALVGAAGGTDELAHAAARLLLALQRREHERGALERMRERLESGRAR